MARVKKITPNDLKKIIYEEKVKLGLVVKEKLNKSDVLKRQIRALHYLKEKAKHVSSDKQANFIKEVRTAIKRELLRSL